jgi:hypothetical protein
MLNNIIGYWTYIQGTYAPINVKPQRGGGSSIGGAFDFFSKFLIKCPTVGQ